MNNSLFFTDGSQFRLRGYIVTVSLNQYKVSQMLNFKRIAV